MARYGITRLFLALDVRGAFPWATLAPTCWPPASSPGSSCAGRPTWRAAKPQALLALGFNGFSTFSTFSYENFPAAAKACTWEAALNVGISVVAAWPFPAFLPGTARAFVLGPSSP